MPVVQWHYLLNSFLNATDGSYKMANTTGNFTNNALSGVPLNKPRLVALRDYFQPVYLNYKTAYDSWKAMGGQEEGATLSLQQLEDATDADVNDWEFTVQGQYRKGTPGYKQLFPKGITGLKRGTRDERVAALNAFSTNLGLTPAFSTLKALVDFRIAQLEDADLTQDTKQSGVKLDSTAVEAARVALCIGLYYVLGGLMMEYAATPASVAAYFDLETLRKRPQTDYTGSVAGDAYKFIVRRKLPETTEVTLRNTGDTSLTFFFAASKTAHADPEQPIAPLEPGEERIVTAAMMGASTSNVYLIVHNRGAQVAGHWEVEI